MTVVSYPAAARQDIHENLHGHDVADPYRWLEDPDSEQARAWQSAQDELWSEVRGALPGRERLAARLAELQNAGLVSPPVWRGDRQFYLRREAGQEHAVLYTAVTGADGRPGEAERALIDPMADRPVGHHHAGQLAARPRGPAAGLPGLRGRPRGVRAADHGRGHRGGRGRAHRPLPLHRGGLAARRQGVLLRPAAAARRRSRPARSSSTAGSTCTGSAPRPRTTCSSTATAWTRSTTTACWSAGTAAGCSLTPRRVPRRATTCGSPT